MSDSQQTHRTKKSTPETQPSPTSSSGLSNSMVQLKASLRGMSYDDQIAALSPVQAHGGHTGGGAHAAAAPGISEGSAAQQARLTPGFTGPDSGGSLGMGDAQKAQNTAPMQLQVLSNQSISAGGVNARATVRGGTTREVDQTNYSGDVTGVALVADGASSMAANPEFEAEAMEFERRLGVNTFAKGNAAATEMSGKAKGYMMERAGAAQWLAGQGTLDDLVNKLACGGDAGDASWSGSVGGAINDLLAVFDSGNVATRMAHMERFYTAIVVPDIKADAAGLDGWLAAGRIAEADLKKFEAKTGVGDATNAYAIPVGSEVEGQGNTRAMRGGDPTTTNSLDDLNLNASPDAKVTLDPAEAIVQGNPGPDTALKWGEGAKIWAMNEKNKWVHTMRQMSIPLAAGPSGTTNKIMNMATLLGVDPTQARLACMGYLMPARHHSLVEIMVAAEKHGCGDYIEGPTMYTSVAPYNEAELRVFGNNKFPHEQHPSQRSGTAQLKALDTAGPEAAPEISGGRDGQTGLPSALKSGIESLSGMSMDDTSVHYNSDKPGQLGAAAYAQGQEIHVGPGQEEHLPHEAWHVVQQAQGRVDAPRQAQPGAAAINQDASLEQEADVMGAKAATLGASGGPTAKDELSAMPSSGALPVQAKFGTKLPKKFDEIHALLVADYELVPAPWKVQSLHNDKETYETIEAVAKKLQLKRKDKRESDVEDTSVGGDKVVVQDAPVVDRESDVEDTSVGGDKVVVQDAPVVERGSGVEDTSVGEDKVVVPNTPVVNHEAIVEKAPIDIPLPAPNAQIARTGVEIDALVAGGIARHHLESLKKEPWEAVLAIQVMVKNGITLDVIEAADRYQTLLATNKKHAPMILAGLLKMNGRKLTKPQTAYTDTYELMREFRATQEHKRTTSTRKVLKPNLDKWAGPGPRPIEHYDYEEETKPIFNSGSQANASMLMNTNLTKAKGEKPDSECFEGLEEETISATEVLDDQERAGIESYTSAGYLTWAKTLKELDPEELASDIPKIRMAVSGIYALPCYSGDVYRGEDKGKTNYVVGETIGFDKFLSTSTIPGTTYAKRKVVQITISGCRTGRDVRLLSTKNDEYEVLFPPGSRFRVDAVTDGGKQVTLTEV